MTFYAKFTLHGKLSKEIEEEILKLGSAIEMFPNMMDSQREEQEKYRSHAKEMGLDLSRHANPVSVRNYQSRKTTGIDTDIDIGIPNTHMMLGSQIPDIPENWEIVNKIHSLVYGKGSAVSP